MTRAVAAFAVVASTFVTAPSAAQALSPRDRHDSFPSTAVRVPAPVVDTDCANARNPALPPDAQGHGQETGGPARELIGR